MMSSVLPDIAVWVTQSVVLKVANLAITTYTFGGTYGDQCSISFGIWTSFLAPDREKVCSIQQKQIVLEQELGRCATEAEVVAYCCLNPDDALLIDSDYVIQNTPNSLDDENWCELHRDKEPQALWVHPADHIANEEIREVLEQAISKLPPELHHVVNLIFTNSNLNCTI